MTYASFLSWLLAAGPKIKLILPLLLQMFEIFQSPALPDGQVTTFAADEHAEALEREVAAAIAEHTAPTALALGDGTRLRGLFKFLRDAGLLPILVGLIPR